MIAYQEKGQPEEAKRTAARLMAARPEFTIAGWRKTQFIRKDKAGSSRRGGLRAADCDIDDPISGFGEAVVSSGIGARIGPPCYRDGRENAR